MRQVVFVNECLEMEQMLGSSRSVLKIFSHLRNAVVKLLFAAVKLYNNG